MSKAGVHIVMGPRDTYGDFVDAIAQAGQTLAVVKCVDDFGAAAEAKAANPLTLTIGRINRGPRGEDMQAWEPGNYPSAQAAAVAYYALCKPKWLLNPFIDVWETFNEYSGNWSWQADFFIALMDIVEPDGFRLGLWACSGGNPPLPGMAVPADRYISPSEAKALTVIERSAKFMRAYAGAQAVAEQPWEAIARACRRAKAHGNHILCLHEYAWDGLLNDSWGNGVVGRYEAIYDYLLSVDAAIPVALTECGQNGGGGFVGTAQFVRDVELCDVRWMKKPYLLGVAMWTLGRWSGANFQTALTALGQYIIAHPTPEPDPIDPPPPPDPIRMYDRVYHLLPKSATYADRMMVDFEADPRGETVGRSIDDAFVTSEHLLTRKVYVWNMADFSEFNGSPTALEAWVAAEYPGPIEIVYREFSGDGTAGRSPVA